MTSSHPGKIPVRDKMNSTNTVDEFLGSLGLTPLLIPIPQTPQSNDDSLLLPPPPPPPLTRSVRFRPSWSDVVSGEEGIYATDCEMHWLPDNTGMEVPYYVKKVNNEFYVYRGSSYIGKAIRGPDGDGPLTGIDTTVDNPVRPVARLLFPSLPVLETA